MILSTTSIALTTSTTISTSITYLETLTAHITTRTLKLTDSRRARDENGLLIDVDGLEFQIKMKSNAMETNCNKRNQRLKEQWDKILEF
jgi:hypothetical protein